MTAPRRNDAAIIARLAPDTVSFLQVPLTPARAARLADFTTRKGIDAQALVLDLLDDVIFDTAETDGRSGTQGGAALPDRPNAHVGG
ncbi:MAG: hypothetical protein LC750_00390 [Actinobacteria bacterium]|nr:hypothetical protein [Actinomycetota bacterium]